MRSALFFKQLIRRRNCMTCIAVTLGSLHVSSHRRNFSPCSSASELDLTDSSWSESRSLFSSLLLLLLLYKTLSSSIFTLMLGSELSLPSSEFAGLAGSDSAFSCEFVSGCWDKSSGFGVDE